MRNIVAIVPCRSGSKGLPHKNFRLIDHRPLYRVAVDQGLRLAETVIVSSDRDLEPGLKNSSIKFHLRNPQLADDTTPMHDVLIDIINTYELFDKIVVLLQPTSPLRSDQDLENALDQFASCDFDLVMSVTEHDRSILKYGMVENGRFYPVNRAEYCFSNRQQLPAIYKPNGALYVFKGQWLVDNHGFDTENIGVIIMPNERSLDIDTIDDFVIAQKKFT